MWVMGVGCQKSGGAADGGWWNIQWECASGFFLFFQHLWLTVLFIGVPVVQGTHLQSFFLCTLSKLKEGDKKWGRKRELGMDRKGKTEAPLSWHSWTASVGEMWVDGCGAGQEGGEGEAGSKGIFLSQSHFFFPSAAHQTRQTPR